MTGRILSNVQERRSSSRIWIPNSKEYKEDETEKELLVAGCGAKCNFLATSAVEV